MKIIFRAISPQRNIVWPPFGTCLKICLIFIASLLFNQLQASANNISVANVDIVNQKESIEIRGKVIDRSNEPLIGASVFIKGTKIGASTDLDGNFKLLVPANVTEFSVSYIGYKDINVAVTPTNTVYNIVLEEDSNLMEEVVVTGYQTIAKERSTGSFAKIGKETLELVRNTNLKSMLEGQVAGYTNGQIRGITTMNAVSQPMVVIDGFPVENTTFDRKGATESMPDLNPEDIENITFLKDAAAASIYGARAANGVIVITTKKAKEGRTEVEASATLTISPYTYHTGYLTDAADVVDMQRQWARENKTLNQGGVNAVNKANQIRNDGAYPSAGVDALLKLYTGEISQSQADIILNDLASRGNRYTDQVREYTKRNPFYQQYNVRVGKTSDKNTFNASATYWRNRSEDVHTFDNKLSLNITNSLKIAKWLTADAGVYLKYGTGETQSYNALSPGFSYLPYDELVSADGSYVTAVSQNKKEIRDNIAKYNMYSELITPMNELGLRIRESKDFSSRVYGKLKFDFTSWLNYDVMFQYENSFVKSNMLSEKQSYNTQSLINGFTSLSPANQLVYNLPNGNSYYSQDNTTNAYNFRHQLNLNKTIAQKHNIIFILGNETRHTKMEYADNTLYGYDPLLLTWENIDAKALAFGVSAINGYKRLSTGSISTRGELVNRFVSIYSNLGYTYDNRYVVSGSIRWDRSNLWGSNIKNQNKPLWSVGGSWVINNEKFFNVNKINLLKLRASYGIGGNIGRNTAPYLVANYFPDNFLGSLAGMIATPPNNDIRWEKTMTTNIGVDFAAFNNRLSGTIEYYHKNSVDLLAQIAGSPTQGLGYTTLTTNNGKMVNSGVEFTFRGDIIQSKGFNWSATLLYAYNKNTVKYISVVPTSINMKLNFPNTYSTIGESYSPIYAYKWAGLSEKGEPQVYNSKGEIVSGPISDSEVDALVYSGTYMPKHSGTFTNVFSFKNFEISAMLVLEAGHKVRDYNIPDINMSTGYIGITSKEINNRWRQEGDVTDVPRLLFSDSESYNTHRSSLYANSDKFVYNASNIRLHNISLAYRLPKNICSKIKLSGIKFRFNVENVAIIAFDKKALPSLKYMINPYGGGKMSPNYVFSMNISF